jgi:hypothetical protein
MRLPHPPPHKIRLKFFTLKFGLGAPNENCMQRNEPNKKKDSKSLIMKNFISNIHCLYGRGERAGLRRGKNQNENYNMRIGSGVVERMQVFGNLHSFADFSICCKVH